jgi:hypothetical protein
MTSESEFAFGFWFGIIVARSIGFKSDQVAVREHLRSVQRWDLTLTPEEVLRIYIDREGAVTEDFLQIVREAESFDRER